MTKIKYLFNNRIQVGYDFEKSYWGYKKPREEIGDPECYQHLLHIGYFWICW